MARFELNDGQAVGSITLHVGHSKRMRVAEYGSVHTALNIRVLDPTLVEVQHKRPLGHGSMTIIFTLHAKRVGRTKLDAVSQDGAAGPAAASLSITVQPTITLPSASSPAGGVARLLLAENRTPFHPAYNATESLQSMQYMRQVLDNRLSNPGLFQAPKAVTLIDIIRASGQFQGFQHYPHLSIDVRQRINDILAVANDDDHPLQTAFITFVSNAVTVASSPSAPVGTTGLVAWRTRGSGSPGKSFKLSISIAGTDFYKLAQ